MKNEENTPIQPVSGKIVPRYAGPATFARLPEIQDVKKCDIAILGIPFDSGTSYRPGARFGPQAIRQASRHLRTQYHPAYDTEPFAELQVVDAGPLRYSWRMGYMAHTEPEWFAKLSEHFPNAIGIGEKSE